MVENNVQILKDIEKRLREAALAYPESYAEQPWGEWVAKVSRKIFLFMGVQDRHLYITTKLPVTGPSLLMDPNITPTGYGLGRSGWLTAKYMDPSKLSVDRLTRWIEESYRAIAPQRLIRELDARSPAAAGEPATTPVATPAKARKAAKPSNETAKEAKPARKKKPRILVLGHDPLRLERAEQSLGKAGFTVTTSSPESKGVLELASPDTLELIVIDLGRKPVTGIDIARDLAGIVGPRVPILFAGTRGREQKERALGAARSVVDASPLEPGDPAFAEKASGAARGR